MQKTLSPKSRPKEIKARIVALSKTISKTIVGVKKANAYQVYVTRYPNNKGDIEYLGSIGITWDSLVDLSGGYQEKAKPVKDTRPEIRKEVRCILNGLRAKIHAAAEELFEDGIRSTYLSRDVFLVAHPEELDNVRVLEASGVSWFQLLLLSGVADLDFSTRDEKRHAGLHFKKLSEIFGISLQHLMFFQKLFSHCMHEYPDRLAKMAENTLQTPCVDDKLHRDILNNWTELIRYLSSIE